MDLEPIEPDRALELFLKAKQAEPSQECQADLY